MVEIKHPEVTVKLIGANGNVFNLIGLCLQTMKYHGLEKDEIDLFITEVYKCDSYDKVLSLMLKWFNVE